MGDLATEPADDYASASRIILDLRGLCFVIDRETLMSLPESILLCLFPNGLMLPDPADESNEGGEEGQVVYVDVRIASLTTLVRCTVPSVCSDLFPARTRILLRHGYHARHLSRAWPEPQLL